MSYITIQRLNKTTLDQRRWMRQQGVDVDRILSHPDLYGMQVLRCKDGQLYHEAVDPCEVLSMRKPGRSDESQGLESMEPITVLPGERL